MITTDQPTIFGDRLVVALSSVDDGDLRFGNGDDVAVRENREAFLAGIDIDPLQATVVQVTYADTTDFARYHVVNEDLQGEGMLEPASSLPADALVAVHPDHALFLLLADCIGIVLFDPANNVLMVSHVGRHSAEIEGARRSVEFLAEEFGSDPAELLVWLSPGVGSETYPLHAMGNRGLQEVIVEQLSGAGVTPDHLEVSPVNTADDENYYSHSEYVAGNRSEDGRFAIVAMMRE